MIQGRLGAVLLAGIDATDIALLADDGHLTFAVVDTGEPVTEILIAYAPTLPELVVKLKQRGLLPPDMPFAEPAALRH